MNTSIRYLRLKAMEFAIGYLGCRARGFEDYAFLWQSCMEEEYDNVIKEGALATQLPPAPVSQPNTGKSST